MTQENIMLNSKINARDARLNYGKINDIKDYVSGNYRSGIARIAHRGNIALNLFLFFSVAGESLKQSYLSSANFFRD